MLPALTRPRTPWRYSTSASGSWIYGTVQTSQGKRQIVDCVNLNRTLSDVTLVLAKRSPFDYLAERPFLKDGRGEGI